MGKFKTQDEIIADFKKVHGDRYDYNKVEYVWSKGKVIIICNKHGAFLQRVDAHKAGQGCKSCQCDEQKLNFEDFKKNLLDTSPMIEILSTDDYAGSFQKIKCKCLVDGHIWHPTVSSLRSRRSGCPKCARYNQTGFYNKAIADSNVDKFIGERAIIYLVMLYNENEIFYKIGITGESAKARFSRGRTKYSYKLIEEIHANLYDAICLEHKLHELNKEFSYIPKIKFSGYTECFSEIKIFENLL
jgi:hypothetical protein